MMATPTSAATTGVYVENQVLFLPSLEQGVSELGDLWNCHSSRVFGRGLFPTGQSGLNEDELSFSRLGKSDFQLHHVKKTKDELHSRKLNGEIAIEILGGLIKPEARFEYDSREESNGIEENLLLHYRAETFKVSANEKAKERISEDMIRALAQSAEGVERPTHVVHRILLGGEMRASVKIKSLKAGTDLVANGLAKVNNVRLGPVSASGRVELAWLDHVAEFDLNRRVEVKSVPDIEGAKRSVDDIFQLLDRFPERIKAETHDILTHVYGARLQFELVPLNVYLNIRPALLYLEISLHTLSRLEAMLLVQKDFMRPNHILQEILRSCPQVELLLQEPNSVFSRQLAEMQTELGQICSEHHVVATRVLQQYKRGEQTEAELQEVICSFESKFNLLQVEMKLDQLVTFGRRELPGHSSAASLPSAVRYFATKSAAELWWAQNDKLKILLVTSTKDSFEEQQIVVASLLQLATKINHSPLKMVTEVGILVPSAGRQLELKVKYVDKEDSYTNQIGWTIRCLECLLVSEASSLETKLHCIATGRQLPLGRETELSTLFELMSLSRRYVKLVLADSSLDLTRKIREGGTRCEWQFVGTIEGSYNAHEVLYTLRSCMESFPEHILQNSTWLAGTFEYNNAETNVDSPLLFVFRAGRLVAVCLDHMDVVLLSQTFHKCSTSPPDLSSFSLTEMGVLPLNRTRAKFALDIWAGLEDNVHQTPTLLRALQNFPEPNDDQLAKTLHVLRALLQWNDVGKRTLFRLIAGSSIVEVVPQLSETLQPALSDPKDTSVLDSQVLLMVSERLGLWLRTNFPHLSTVWDALQSLHLEMLTEHQMKHAAKLIEGTPAGFPKELKEQIQSRLQRLELEATCQQLEAQLDAYLTEVGKKNTTVQTALDFLQFLYSRNLSRSTLLFLEPLVSETLGRFPNARNRWEDLDLFGCLSTLSPHRFHPALVASQQHLATISVVMEAEETASRGKPNLVSFLQDLCTPTIFSSEQLGELWLNPKFRIFMSNLVCDDDHLLEILARQYGTRARIPYYIPSELRVKLEQSVSSMEQHQLTENVSSVRELEVVLSRILHLGKVGDGFTGWLADCLRSSDELRLELETASALPSWWNPHDPYVKGAWGLNSVRDALDAITSARQVDTTMLDTQTPRSSGRRNIIESDMRSLDAQVSFGVSSRYRELIGEAPTQISMRQWTEIRELVRRPSLPPLTPYPVAAVLPFTMQRLKMWSQSALTSEQINSYLARPVQKDDDESPFSSTDPTTEEMSEVREEMNPCPLHRLDILSVLLQISHPFVQEELLRILTQFPVAIPVVLPSIKSDSFFDCLLPLLSCGVQRWEQGSAAVGQQTVENRMMTDSYHLIMAVRIGTSPRSGKSTILNQLFRHKHMFASGSDPGAEYGPPTTLPGAVELTWLTQETVDEKGSLWTESLQTWYATRNELILLANLHGDAFDHPATVRLLSQLVSTVLVFFMPDDKTTHLNKLVTLKKLLDPTIETEWESRFKHVLVNPLYTAAESHCVYTERLVEDAQLSKIRNKIDRALVDHPTRPVKSLESLNENQFKPIRIRHELVPHTASSLLKYLQTNSCSHLRKALCLQRTNAGRTNERPIDMWRSSPELQKVVTLFADVLRLPIQDRMLALNRVDKVLAQMSSKESAAARCEVLKHKQELILLLTTESSEKEKADKQALIRRGYKTVDSHTLGLEHFFRELGKLQELAALYDVTTNFPNGGVANTFCIESMARWYAELLVAGQSIELLDGDAGELNASWITAICTSATKLVPGLRVFVLSIIGLQSSGKSTLLNALFACKFSVSVGRCTKGLFLRLLFLEPNLARECGTDAVLLIDTEGLGAPEKINEEGAEKKDRLMATFAMAVSNLTIINVLGESFGELKNILQIAVVALSRLEKACMSPDIRLVQHLAQRDGGALTEEGVDVLCDALDKAIELTKNEGEVGVQNSVAIRKLRERVGRRDLRQQFQTFKNGGSLNAPPSSQYHDDVVELREKILSTAKSLATKPTFEEWHSILPDLWQAMQRENFAVRFKDIKDMDDFIRRGQLVTGVKNCIDAAMQVHVEKERQHVLVAFRKGKEEVLRLDARHVDSANERNQTHVFQAIDKHLADIPFACSEGDGGGRCEKCTSATRDFNSTLAVIPDEMVKRKTEETMMGYLQKTRREHGNALKQGYSTIVVKDRDTECFDTLINTRIRRALKMADEDNTNELKTEEGRVVVVEEIWASVQREVAEKHRVENLEERIQSDVEAFYESLFDGLPQAFKRREFPQLDQTLRDGNSTVVVQVEGGTRNPITWLLGQYRKRISQPSSPYSKEACWLMNELLNLPNQVLVSTGSDRYSSGMVAKLHALCQTVFREFSLNFPDTTFQLLPEYKVKCYLFALGAFLDKMQRAEDKWNKENHPLIAFRSQEKRYKKYIESRLLFGFTFGSEGTVLAARVVECAVHEASKSVQEGAAGHVLGHPWIQNAQNVRLKYFSQLALGVEDGQHVSALLHFSNPEIAIKAWFKETVESLDEHGEYRRRRFLPVFREKLSLMKTEVLNEVSLTGALAVVRRHMLSSLGVDYICTQNLTEAKGSDLQNFKQAFSEGVTTALEPPLPDFSSLSQHKAVSERLGCTKFCKWCGALCWGDWGHELNADDTAKHHSSHQISGLHGVHYENSKNLLVEKCHERTDECRVFFGQRSGSGEPEFRMSWAEAKAHEYYRDWKYSAHCKTQFNDLMTWFFIKLNKDIAKERKLKPPAQQEMDTLSMDSTLTAILATIKATLE